MATVDGSFVYPVGQIDGGTVCRIVDGELAFEATALYFLAAFNSLGTRYYWKSYTADFTDAATSGGPGAGTWTTSTLTILFRICNP